MPFKDPIAKRDYMQKWLSKLTDEERQRRKEYMRNYQRKYMPAWRAANPKKWKKIAHRSYVAHKDAHLANCKKWNARNPEKCRAYSKEWNRRNPEKVRAKAVRYYPKARLISKRWEKLNPHKIVDKDHRRRARKVAATTEDCAARIDVLRRERFCHWCCEFMPLGTATIDHVVPLARGGEHCNNNLVAACLKCNSSKGTKLVHEWTWREAA